MADIDLDLPWDRREQVMRWVYDRWGHDRVAMVGAPNTFRGRAAVAELGKVYGLPPSEIHRITRRLPAYARAGQLERAIAVSRKPANCLRPRNLTPRSCERRACWTACRATGPCTPAGWWSRPSR
jgi:DNA polymerase III alpha subunit